MVFIPVRPVQALLEEQRRIVGIAHSAPHQHQRRAELDFQQRPDFMIG